MEDKKREFKRRKSAAADGIRARQDHYPLSKAHYPLLGERRCISRNPICCTAVISASIPQCRRFRYKPCVLMVRTVEPDRHNSPRPIGLTDRTVTGYIAEPIDGQVIHGGHAVRCAEHIE